MLLRINYSAVLLGKNVGGDTVSRKLHLAVACTIKKVEANVDLFNILLTFVSCETVITRPSR